MDKYELPPEFEASMKQLAETQPELVREMFHWAMAMWSVEKGMAQIVEQHAIGGREYYTFASPEGDVVTAAKPNASDDLLSQMLTTVRELAKEEARHNAEIDQRVARKPATDSEG